MDSSFLSTVVLLLLVMDPVGNVPLFVSALRGVAPQRRMRVIARECLIAFSILIVFALTGDWILNLFGISDPSLTIAGGVILFLIALRMVFGQLESVFPAAPAGEPFIVPLATPAVAGPAAIATVILLSSAAGAEPAARIAAISVATLLTLTILVAAGRISNWLGERGLAALERLMGLILTAIAIEMLLTGITKFVRQF